MHSMADAARAACMGSTLNKLAVAQHKKARKRLPPPKRYSAWPRQFCPLGFLVWLKSDASIYPPARRLHLLAYSYDALVFNIQSFARGPIIGNFFQF